MNRTRSRSNGQNGSIFFITILILALLTIIGIASTNTTITESYIVRNDSLQKQNTHMVNAGMAECLQKIMDMETGVDGYTESDLDPLITSLPWMNGHYAWENAHMDDDWLSTTYVGQVLNATNSTEPDAILNPNLSDGVGIDNLFSQRGELGAHVLRYAFVGWSPAPGYSLKPTKATRKAGRILGEYVSPRFGVKKVQLGLEKKF